MDVIPKWHTDIKNINLWKISEAKLEKDIEAKNKQRRAEKSSPLQEQKVQLPPSGLRKGGRCALLKKIWNKHTKLCYNSTTSINLVSIEPDRQPLRAPEFKTESIQLNLLISFILGLTCLNSKLFYVSVLSSGVIFN